MEPDAVTYYHSLGRFGVQPGLERIRALCALLGDPQNAFRCVHVAGTNGKGSTSTMLASILRSAGYRTGLYTSPYVLDFRERIRLNGDMISEAALADVTDQVRKAVETLNGQGIWPTEFEAVTAAAFLYYARQGCEIAVLEAGLGGRFDATNLIVKPLVSVITSISFDHTAVLGDTLAKIAWEKSGIIKQAAPVVTTDRQPHEAFGVIASTAASLNAPLLISCPSEQFVIGEGSLHGTKITYHGIETRCPFPGAHQLENLGLVLKAVDALREKGIMIPDAAVKTGLDNSFIPARCEVLSTDPLVLLDGSHNPGGVGSLKKLINTYLPNKRLLAVTGMMEDKDLQTVVPVLASLFERVITVTPSNPRAIPADRFAEIFREQGVLADAAPDVESGIVSAFESLPSYDGLVVCGSLYLAADARPILIDTINTRFHKGGKIS
ncbi:MAG: bifunctional folylpolyglutamate synthase/dihydrofolate synthase [Clostridia bacterium]|nr:bifunctional folylpolyglutamate synthase/dihydrofolate synthase [Clostridia bacterium]